MSTLSAFIGFRIFFNSRFYYPIYTILFLDHGLSLSQFTILNSVWAFTIFCLEVPSGALADLIGRKILVQFASFIMLLELLILFFVPMNFEYLFVCLMINRILSGTAEALASGADESLAYDSLPEENRESVWADLTAKLIRMQSLSFFIVMLVGGFIYDYKTLNRVFSLKLDLSDTLKLPILFTLIMAILAIVCTFFLKEESKAEAGFKKCLMVCNNSMLSTITKGLKQILDPKFFYIIIFGLVLNGFLLQFLMLNSEFFRYLKIPVVFFGLIGASGGLLGVFVPPIAKYMHKKFSYQGNFRILIIGTFIALGALSINWGLYTLLFFLLLFIMMHILKFMNEQYIHKWASAGNRATVVSFKSLLYSLSFGIAGLFYSWYFAYLEKHPTFNTVAFSKSLGFFPLGMLIALILAFIVVMYHQRGQKQGKKTL